MIRQGFLDTPAPVKSAGKGWSGNAYAASPFPERVRFSSESNTAMVADGLVPEVFLVGVHRGGEGFFDAHTILGQALADEVLAKPEFITPFLHCLLASAEGEHPVVASIILLLLDGGPSAVFRGVIFLAVDSVELMEQGGLLTHIRHKGVKGIKPTLANADTLCTVVLIVLVCVPVAPGSHTVICLVQRVFRLVQCAGPQVDGETMSLPH